METELTLDEFTRLVQDELGLPVTDGEIAADLDRLPGWDSLQLLRLIAVLERQTGRRVPLSGLLEARSLRAIHSLAVRA